MLELSIESLGQRGEGLVRSVRGTAHIPGALPRERVLARLEGERGKLIEILEASPERVAPICSYFGDCGGCATQHLGRALYSSWKREILAGALADAHIEAPLGALIDAHGEGRRRATFHARFATEGAHVEIGFMQARAHRIVEIEACPVLAPPMSGAIGAARALAACLRGVGKPLDISVTATLSGLDIDIRGCGPLEFSARQKLVHAADRLDLARLSNHGEAIIERRTPEILMGAARVSPPPGGFLQATLEGERILAELALSAVQGARRVADLFCGVGAFALRLAARHEVRAVEVDRPALTALARAAGATPGLRGVACEVRDLFHRPLGRDELKAFDAVVFDPPRAGALAQSRELAASGVQTIVAISCNAATFARDVSILAAGGYRLESVTPIDQFRFSPHIEIVGVLRKPPAGKPRKGLRAKGFLG
ncbi:class I SAM-dependent RNA methyltransferase [Methylocapsa sp. S129]|uniref:class I SAM-dependent RNA methyltransferase n=1 Tax=Methylocapsa sp. S129 TaxID=1641869 RepID=UPI0015776F56|nr:class I SAM-dependent RNA methyltransferase [Methylocapsa sp. S129]